MYNAGKPAEFPKIGTAYFAYDCVTDKLCVAAHLDSAKIADCKVVESSNSWVSISGNSGKYDASNDIVFEYVRVPDPLFLPNGKPIGKLLTWQHHV